MATNESFARALRHYRNLAAMSQESLASAASLDRTYISQLERGQKSPTLNTLAKLAECLDTTGRPRVAAVFYASHLAQKDWGEIVQPTAGGGRTTSVSIMARSGIRKMYEGWLCVLSTGGYREFLNNRNGGDLIV